MGISNYIFIALFFSVVTTIIYRILPFRALADRKPSIDFFPKYKISYSEYQKATQSIIAEGFSLSKDDVYVRGHMFGDFSIRYTKLEFKIDIKKQEVLLQAPYLGIVFDAGEVWSLIRAVEKNML